MVTTLLQSAQSLLIDLRMPLTSNIPDRVWRGPRWRNGQLFNRGGTCTPACRRTDAVSSGSRPRGQGLFDAPVEKVAENILEDLLVEVLDWSLGDVNFQVGRADIVLSALGIKRLVLEVKRPGALVWNRRAVKEAPRVGTVAVSDGHLLYAADVTTSGLRDRILVALDTDKAPEELWWLSVHGIYRPCPR